MEKVSPKQAAKYLGHAQQTLANWRHRGEGPRFLKIGGKVFYPVRELEAFLRASLRTSTSDRGEGVSCGE